MEGDGKIMKVLAVMGCPRKGDSYKVTKIIEKCIKDRENIDFEYFYLKDTNINKCLGCHNCVLTGEENCPHWESIREISDRMKQADGLIFVTQVYDEKVTVLMKNFVDHFSFLWHRPMFFNKKSIIISTGPDFKRSLEYLKENIKAWGFSITGDYGISHLDTRRDEINSRNIDNLRNLGYSFYDTLLKNEIHKPGLGDLFWFRVCRHKARLFKEHNSLDYLYWKNNNWFNDRYFYKVDINPLLNWCSLILGKFFSLGMNKKLERYY